MYLLFLDLVLQGRDLDLHLLYLVLRQDLDAMTRVRVVQGLKGQVCQRDVPLALILLMAAVDEKRTEGSRQASLTHLFYVGRALLVMSCKSIKSKENCE